MRGLISDNFEVCFTHRKLQCWKLQHNSTGKTFYTLSAIPAPFRCTWLKDRYEVTMKFTGQRGSLSLQNSRSTFYKLLPQVCSVTRRERLSKVLQPLDSRHLHSSPASPRPAEGSFWVSINNAQGPARGQQEAVRPQDHQCAQEWCQKSRLSCDSWRQSLLTTLRIHCTPVTRGSRCCSASQSLFLHRATEKMGRKRVSC